MKKFVAEWGFASAALMFAFACNNSDQPATESLTMPFSNWSMGCESRQGGSSQQQQQVGFKHPEQQQNCSKQAVEFPKQGISDFHFDVDCEARRVHVTQLGDASSGRAFRTESFPIQADDSFKGQMASQRQLPKDGKGNLSCWVEFVVIFDGKCKCEQKDDGTWRRSLDVRSTVALQQANFGVPGGGHPSPVPSVSPSPSPSSSMSPSPEPSESPSPSPMPSPSPHPSGSPHPTPTVVPVVVCVVDNNVCPWVGDGQMKCE